MRGRSFEDSSNQTRIKSSESLPPLSPTLLEMELFHPSSKQFGHQYLGFKDILSRLRIGVAKGTRGLVGIVFKWRF